ncbi:hypothetical protein ACP4OV_020298 [Aristida adscensionis]
MSRARQNAMRSGVVVLGSVAFGYLSFRVGFKPYLDRAQEAMDADSSPTNTSSSDSTDAARDGASGDGSGAGLAQSRDPAVVLRD